MLLLLREGPPRQMSSRSVCPGARLVGYLSYAHPEPPGPDLATLIGLAERRISGKAVLTVG